MRRDRCVEIDASEIDASRSDASEIDASRRAPPRPRQPTAPPRPPSHAAAADGSATAAEPTGTAEPATAGDAGSSIALPAAEPTGAALAGGGPSTPGPPPPPAPPPNAIANAIATATRRRARARPTHRRRTDRPVSVSSPGASEIVVLTGVVTAIAAAGAPRVDGQPRRRCGPCACSARAPRAHASSLIDGYRRAGSFSRQRRITESSADRDHRLDRRRHRRLDPARGR